MDFLGIGPLEIIFILLIALIIFGPKDIIKTGQVIGRFLRKLITSPGWRAVQQTSRDLRNLPNKLIREAGLDDVKKEVQDVKKEVYDVKKDVDDLKTIAQPLDMKREIKAELDKVSEGLSAWTSLPPPDKPIPAENESQPPASPPSPTESS